MEYEADEADEVDEVDEADCYCKDCIDVNMNTINPRNMTQHFTQQPSFSSYVYFFIN